LDRRVEGREEKKRVVRVWPSEEGKRKGKRG